MCHQEAHDQRFLQIAVLAGLDASENELVADAVERLRQSLPAPAPRLAKKAKRKKPALKKKRRSR
jgi:hypothetical protein